MKILLNILAIFGIPLTVVGILTAFTHDIFFLLLGGGITLFVILLIYVLILIFANRSDHVWLNAVIYFFTPTPKSTHLFLSRDITYEFLDRTTMVLTKKMRIKSLVNDLRSIDDRYLWSKPSKCDLTIDGQKHRIMYEWKDMGWYYYSMLLGRPLSKGDSEDITVRMPNLSDPHKESSLFLSSDTIEKTRELSLTIKSTKNLPIKKAEFCIFHGSICTTPKYKKELDVEGDGTKVSKTIKFPRVGYKYLIRWEFDNP